MEAASEEQASDTETIDYSKFTINLVLSKTTRKKLSRDLNPPRCLPTDDGLPKDWRGLASLVGLNASDIPYTEKDPTDRILELWFERYKSTCTIQILKNFLCQLDRWDIYDDTKEMIDNDIKEYVKLQNESSNSAIKSKPIIEDTALTTHDIIRMSNGLTPQYYDAFVLFAEADIEFATSLMSRLEDVYNLKLCTKNRDLIGGHVFEHSLIMKLISERCNRLLVIITQAFLECSLYQFFVRFSQAVGIEQQLRKIVPLKLENCRLPTELSYYHIIDYTKRDTFQNFWEKLYLSLKPVAAIEIKRRATTVRSAQTRPVIQSRPKSESYVVENNEIVREDISPVHPRDDAVNGNQPHSRVQFIDGIVLPSNENETKPKTVKKWSFINFLRVKSKKNGKQKPLTF